MNIAKELAKVERKHRIQEVVKRAYNVIKNLLCQHKECYNEIVNVELGNCTSSLLEEILGKEESKKKHKMRIRIVRCINCNREIYREYLEDSEEEK